MYVIIYVHIFLLYILSILNASMHECEWSKDEVLEGNIPSTFTHPEIQIRD